MKTPASINKYNNCKKEFQKKLKLSRQEYFKNKLLDTSGNLKQKWDVIRVIINKKKSISDYCPVQNELLGRHYSTIAEKLHLKLKNINCTANTVVEVPVQDNRFCFTEVSEKEVYESILHLNNSKGPGPDNFNIKALKYVADIISPHLTRIFNCCINEGLYPSGFKIAKCVAIYKGNKTDPNDPLSYRPISILNSLNKAFERLLYDQLYTYIENFNILPKYQYGYRKNHSTCQAVLDFAKHIENIIDRNETAIAVFMDLSKAFDTVDKSILSKKLNKLGIAGISNKLLVNYMSNRKFCMNNDNDTLYDMNYGVPQGSILGPLLFLIYIYDMQYIAPLISSIVYADDTTIILNGKTVTEAVRKANIVMDQYYNYFTVNKLTINEGKTKYMLFTKSKKSSVNNNEDELCINGIPLERVNSIKFLGIFINDQLNWNDHKRYVHSKISRNLGILYKCRDIMVKEDLINMYNSFIMPYLLYCLPLWGGSVKSNKDVVVKTQNKAMRILFNTKRTGDAWRHSLDKTTHTILPIKELYKVEIAKFCYKHIKNDLPNHFINSVMPIFAHSIHNTNTRHRTTHNYQLNKDNTLPLAFNSFTTQCIRIWNALPALLKVHAAINNNSIKTFTTNLKTSINHDLWISNNIDN